MEAALDLDHVRPTDLPAPPKETLRIVHACAADDVDSQELGRMIANDPVLTAEILRIANSPFFGVRAQVTTAARAVTLIGHQAVRNITLCIAMRDVLRPEAIPGLDLNRFWEAALRRAVCARSLSERAGLDADECFTAGLLQDIGLLGLLYVHQEHVPEWPRLEAANPDDRLEQERTLFHTTHARAGMVLAREWALPPDLVAALGHHHALVLEELPANVARLCNVLHCADWMAAVFAAEDKRMVLTRCRELLHQRLGLDNGAAESLLDRIGSDMTAAATAFGFSIEAQDSLEQVLRDANLRLAEDNLTFQEMTWELEHALAQRDRIAAELGRELALAREVQRSLLPRAEPPPAGVYGLNVSAREVSGDFFDYFPSRDGLRCFAIADVAGKGMNAALLMAKTSSLLHCLGKVINEPTTLMAMLNREICEKAVRGMFVTMIVGVYDPASGRGKLVNAGHLPVLQLESDGGFGVFGASAPPLGIVPEIKYAASTFDLKEGPLYLYTDGLVETERNGAQLGISGLKQLIRDHRGRPPDQRLQRIAEQVRAGAETPRDDLTLLLVEA